MRRSGSEHSEGRARSRDGSRAGSPERGEIPEQFRTSGVNLSESPQRPPPLSGAWAEAELCAVCGVALGKRRGRPRHHCRICGNSVCAGCSPSSVQLELPGGERSLQRACNPCVSIAQRAPVLGERLVHLAAELHAVAGMLQWSEDEVIASLEDAVLKCEATLPTLAQEREHHQDAKLKVEDLTSRHEAAENRASEAEAQGQQLAKQFAKLRRNEVAEAEAHRAKQSQSEELLADLSSKLERSEQNAHDAMSAPQAKIVKAGVTPQDLLAELQEAQRFHIAEQSRCERLEAELSRQRQLMTELSEAACQHQPRSFLTRSTVISPSLLASSHSSHSRMIDALPSHGHTEPDSQQSTESADRCSKCAAM